MPYRVTEEDFIDFMESGVAPPGYAVMECDDCRGEWCAKVIPATRYEPSDVVGDSCPFCERGDTAYVRFPEFTVDGFDHWKSGERSIAYTPWGVHVSCPSGWTVSVQWGPVNYGSNHGVPIPGGDEDKLTATTAEVAAWDARHHYFEWADGDIVQGFKSWPEVHSILATFANDQQHTIANTPGGDDHDD